MFASAVDKKSAISTHFPFENSNIVKHRPAIVINDDEIAILAMYVTSKDKETPYSIEITDWE